MEDEEDGVRRVRGLWLRSARLGLVGKADVVEFRPIAPSPPTPLPRGGEGGSTSDGSPLTPLPRKAEGGSTSAPHPLPLSSEGARGETNEIPFPVEYKRGRKRRWDNDEVQLCAQAMCLEEMLGVQVPAGAIFHVKTRRRREVSFTPALRAQTEDAARRLHELLASGRTPLPVFKPRCKGCSVRDLCFPQTLDNPARVRDYCRQLWVTGPG
ncbi:MAG: CRISPR-associated protein Cas4 [Planctomycetes bacterium]|nr:CRISPR-associated protein Cas4 [Planctomycetota bacterium]